MTVSVVLLDCVAFRSMLPPEYVSYYTGPLRPRTVLSCLKAVQEEVIRLIVMSALVGLGHLVLRRTPPATFVLAAVVSQLFLIWPHVVDFGAYEVLRYWAVGSVWGLLYWRHGWLAALLGHSTIHLLLDPLLLALL